VRFVDAHGMRCGRVASFRIAGVVIFLMAMAGLFGCASIHDRFDRSAATPKIDARLGWPVIVETPRVIVCSDGSREDAELHARWMERTIEAFERFTARAGWPTVPLDEPLTAMLFSRQDDLRAFAARHDRVNIGATSGYYSPRNDWVVMNVGTASLTADDHLNGLAGSSEGEVLANPQAGLALRSDEAEETHHHGSPAARCVHETIHQLMFRSGLMDHRVTYPLWIAEGLATAFETDDPESAIDAGFGPDVDHAPRTQAFAAALAAGRLIPVHELVTVTSLPHESIDMHDFYNQSYALTTWLCRERPGEALAFLRLLNGGDAWRRSANQHMALFERTFGSIDSVASEWLNAVR